MFSFFFAVSYCNDKTGIALVRARHGPHKIVMSTVPLVTKVGDKKASLRTLYTGATLLKCKQFIMVCFLIHLIIPRNIVDYVLMPYGGLRNAALLAEKGSWPTIANKYYP